MPATPQFSLPYPAPADPADVPADMQRLAEKLDALLPPVGTPLPWLTGTIPTGYIEFAGQGIAAATYPKLYAVFGATLPNLRGRFLFGVVPGSHADGETGGEETHALTLAELAAHGHSVNDPGHSHLDLAPGHSHAPSTSGAYFAGTQNAALGPLGTLNAYLPADPAHSLWNEPGTSLAKPGTDGAFTGLSLVSAGGNGAHNNMPPFRAVRWITIAA